MCFRPPRSAGPRVFGLGWSTNSRTSTNPSVSVANRLCKIRTRCRRQAVTYLHGASSSTAALAGRGCARWTRYCCRLELLCSHASGVSGARSPMLTATGCSASSSMRTLALVVVRKRGLPVSAGQGTSPDKLAAAATSAPQECPPAKRAPLTNRGRGYMYSACLRSRQKSRIR